MSAVPETIVSPEGGTLTCKGTVADLARTFGTGKGKPPSVNSGPGYCRCTCLLWGTGKGWQAELLGAAGTTSEIKVHPSNTV